MAKGNNKVVLDGYIFDSPSEAEFYKKIKHAKEVGYILDCEISPKYELQPSFKDWKGKKIEPITHLPDYLITRLDGSKYIVDTKGGSHHEAEAIIKRKMWMYHNQQIPYYYASIVPKFIGGAWTETTSGNNFEKKLRNLYDELYPGVNKRLKGAPKLSKKDVEDNFEYVYYDNLFYRMIKKYTKKDKENIAKEKSNNIKNN